MRAQRLTDLGLDGDSAHALLRAVEHKFDVDFEGFRFLRYFSEEGWAPFRPLVVFVLERASPDFARRWRAASDAERDVTVAHLIAVAEAKRWSEPALPRARAAPSLLAGAFGVLAPLILALAPAVYLAAYIGTSGRSALGMLAGVGAFSAVIAVLIWNAWRGVERKLDSA